MNTDICFNLNQISIRGEWLSVRYKIMALYGKQMIKEKGERALAHSYQKRLNIKHYSNFGV